VHPIEQLRYVARARGADASAMVRETASAVRGLRLDPAGLVVACRRIVERHPASGPLWWLCARLLVSGDPFVEARSLADAFDADPTPDVLVDTIPEGATVVTVGLAEQSWRPLTRRGDLCVLVVEAGHRASAFAQRLERADVVCDVVPVERAAVAVESADLVLLEADAVGSERAVVPIGSAVVGAAAHVAGIPVWLVAGRGRRLPDPMIDAMIARLGTWEDHEPFPLRLVTDIVGPDGRTAVSPAAVAAECSMVAELLRQTAM
jgi:hypothetical protein